MYINHISLYLYSRHFKLVIFIYIHFSSFNNITYLQYVFYCLLTDVQEHFSISSISFQFEIIKNSFFVILIFIFFRFILPHIDFYIHTYKYICIDISLWETSMEYRYTRFSYHTHIAIIIIIMIFFFLPNSIFIMATKWHCIFSHPSVFFFFFFCILKRPRKKKDGKS